MKTNNLKLTEAEYEIMSVLWREERPLSKADILDLSTNQSWKSSSTHALLRSLLSKRAIEVHSYSKIKNNKFRLYCPAITKEQYELNEIVQNKSINRNTLPHFVSSLLSESDDESLIDELEEIIAKKKRGEL